MHLALPATLSAAAADELSEALAPLGADPRRALARGRDQAPGRPDRARAQGRPPAVLHLRALGRRPGRPAELAAQLLP